MLPLLILLELHFKLVMKQKQSEEDEAVEDVDRPRQETQLETYLRDKTTERVTNG